ncbi:MAG: PEP-CTERM sorting domain-containing protein [Casimicrobiaceae bacterium]
MQIVRRAYCFVVYTFIALIFCLARQSSAGAEMSKRTRGSRGSLLAAATLLALSIGSAHAAVIRGNADPQFTLSGSLSGLYWSSTILFTVADTCIAGTGTSSCAVSVTSATAALAGNVNVNLSFLAGLPSMMSIHHTAGMVDAFDAAVIGPSAMFTDPNLTGFAWIDWGIGAGNLATAQLFIQQCSSHSDDDDDDHHDRSKGKSSTSCTPSFRAAAGSTVPAVITITTQTTQIPEPGALALLLTALSALWWVRRRGTLRK